MGLPVSEALFDDVTVVTDVTVITDVTDVTDVTVVTNRQRFDDFSALF